VRGLTSVVISFDDHTRCPAARRRLFKPAFSGPEIPDMPIEELRMLDHDPMAAFADDMKLGIRQALHHEQRTFKRRDPVVTSP